MGLLVTTCDDLLLLLPAVHYNGPVGSTSLNPLDFIYQCYQSSSTGRYFVSTPAVVMELGHLMSRVTGL